MCNGSFFFTFFLFYYVILFFCTLTRKKISHSGIFYICVSFLCLFLLYVMNMINSVWLQNFSIEFLWKLNTLSWLTLDVCISFKVDTLSFFFVLLVLAIGFATNIYILNYFKYEANEDIFILLINWFMFSMLILVLANNLFTLFLGWESIGLSSYFLINFWSSRRGTVKSSFKAFFFNKISDTFLFLFLIIVNVTLSLNDLTGLNLESILMQKNFSPLIFTGTICLVVCTLFKSAQLVGHLWLPDSMEAPVPASALIHSATLVSAGVYLLLRFNSFISLANFQIYIVCIGSITAAYGGLVSAAQTDMKRLLAYSTISHCGFLFVSVGTELFTSSIVYLFLHGLFKALTFFCAGSFIRVAGSQDTRQMGGLSRVLPVDTILLIICAFNLGGLPFSLGYTYKSFLITGLLNTNTNYMFLALCFFGLLTSIVYVYRLVYYSAFDTVKEFFPSIIYELQQKHINVVKYWSFTTIIQVVAVTLLLVFSVWIYIYFSSYFIGMNLTLQYTPLLFESGPATFTYSNFFFKSFYEIFYSIYLLVFIIIIFLNWRYEFSFFYKLNFFLNVSLTILFFNIYSTIF